LNVSAAGFCIYGLEPLGFLLICIFFVSSIMFDVLLSTMMRPSC
jgi:hypothetical protein